MAIWDEEEDDYSYGHKEEYQTELTDKCLECGEELEEMPCIPTLSGGYGVHPAESAGG